MTQSPFWLKWLPRPVYDPMTIISAAGLGLSAIGTVTSAAGQMAQGRASADAARYQGQVNSMLNNYRASMADYNVQVDEMAAERAVNEAHLSADIIGRSNARVLGRAQAGYAVSGVTPGGSALDVMNDIATEGRLQEKLAIYQGDVTATGFRNQANLDRSQAAIYRAMASAGVAMADMSANAAMSGAAIGAGTTLLTGLGRTAMSAYDLSTVASRTPPGTIPQVGGQQYGPPNPYA